MLWLFRGIKELVYRMWNTGIETISHRRDTATTFRSRCTLKGKHQNFASFTQNLKIK